MASLQRLMGAYRVDPARILQQSICYDHRRKWSVSISWGYTAQLYPSLISSKVLGTPLQTFRTWRSWHEGPFVFNTRPLKVEPCEQPIIYFLDQAEDFSNGKTITVYKQVAAAENQKKCNHSVYMSAMSIQKIKVSSLKTDPEEPMKVCYPSLLFFFFFLFEAEKRAEDQHYMIPLYHLNMVLLLSLGGDVGTATTIVLSLLTITCNSCTIL